MLVNILILNNKINKVNNEMEKYETMIGLEVHMQINTKSKIFCECSTDFGCQPNSNTCVICTSQPGALPLLNKQAIEAVVKTGLALNCKINVASNFSRKQYFYPDLPKNYQITQFSLPLCYNGTLKFIYKDKEKIINIQRIHLEEDAGKLIHKDNYSLLDLNRAGIGLMELVTSPELHSAEESFIFLNTLKDIVEYLATSQCNMEQGQMRCDVNISIRQVNQQTLGTKVEIKNLNSISAVQDAINYEYARQIKTLTDGGKVVQETRAWDSKLNITKSTRPKENCLDYRYFTEPNLIPLNLNDTLITKLYKEIPELPYLRKQRFMVSYQLNAYDASYLTSTKLLADYYEKAVKFSKNNKIAPKLLANWIATELISKLNVSKLNIDKSPVTSENLAKLIDLIISGKISGKIAKQIFVEMYKTSIDPVTLINKMNMKQISNESIIIALCNESIKENSKAAFEFQTGKVKAIDYIVGTVMKKSKGKANPQLVVKIIKELLKNSVNKI
ncbi:MAG: Asp-tRNA(Asn)/Glu-tRNA(Gln) amidotransferase subunit GatB [Endomicrobium sp.]|jgi:aspartyl-tRNA(Asn)/glutamyl-tRNA(Gln) amidotransferase subunit B|nr:Asp-tRNA(Asn)/Glu-tRNA(Gln) amidotransferase subunit GatB [Endomicrobium sp.]